MTMLEGLEETAARLAILGRASGDTRWEAAELMRAAKAEIERLQTVLLSLTEDPPATLDEPDPDWEVIIKMRNIAREALGLPRGFTQ